MGRSYFNQRIKKVLLILIIPVMCWQSVDAVKTESSGDSDSSVVRGCRNDRMHNHDNDIVNGNVTSMAIPVTVIRTMTQPTTGCKVDDAVACSTYAGAIAHYHPNNVSEITDGIYAEYHGVDSVSIYDDAIAGITTTEAMRDRFNDDDAVGSPMMMDEMKGLQSGNMMMTKQHRDMKDVMVPLSYADEYENTVAFTTNNHITKARDMHDKQFGGQRSDYGIDDNDDDDDGGRGGAQTMTDPSKLIDVILSTGNDMHGSRHQHRTPVLMHRENQSNTHNNKNCHPSYANSAKAIGSLRRNSRGKNDDAIDEFTMTNRLTNPTTIRTKSVATTAPITNAFSTTTTLDVTTKTSTKLIINSHSSSYIHYAAAASPVDEEQMPVIAFYRRAPASVSPSPLFSSSDEDLMPSVLQQNFANNINGGPTQSNPDVTETGDGRSNGSRPASLEKPTICEIFTDDRSQLIYEFAIKFKQSPHVSYLTCQQRLKSIAGLHTNCHSMALLKGLHQRSLETEMLRSNSNDDGDASGIDSVLPEGVGIRNSDHASKDDSNNNNERTDSKNDKETQVRPGSVLIKIVQIDELINTRERTANNNNNGNKYNNTVDNIKKKLKLNLNDNINGNGNIMLKPISGKFNRVQQQRRHNRRGKPSAFTAGTGANVRNENRFSGSVSQEANANWLEHILRSPLSRQIIVLDLSCGPASSRILQMASTKSLFNVNFHWLLIEDYIRVAHGPDATEQINDVDNDDVMSVSSSNNKNTKNATMNEVYRTKRNNQNAFQDAIEHKAGRRRLSLEWRSIFARNGDAVTVAAAGANQKQENLKAKVRSMKDTRSLTNAYPESATSNEEELEIIEKFLQRININMDTELILAKRRSYVEPNAEHIPDEVYNGEVGGSGRCGVSNVKETAASGNNTVLVLARPLQPFSTITSQVKMTQQHHNQEQQVQCNKALQKKDYYALYDVWSPGKQYGGKLNITEIGNFTLTHGIRTVASYQASTTITRRMDMKMARLRCLVVITNKNRSDNLEHYLTTHVDMHLDSMNRFNFALLSLVRDYFNFSFAVAKTSTWGYLKKGKFDGMIGALVRKQADVGGSPIFFRLERARVIDYTAQTWRARPCFIFRHPRSTLNDRIIFLQPFTNGVWILLSVCGVITVLLLWILHTTEAKKCNPQGLSLPCHLLSGRCIILISLLFSFTIFQFYSASIVGSLLMERPRSIRTLRDLVDSSLEVGIEDIVYNRDFFLRTRDSVAMELYARKVTTVPKNNEVFFGDSSTEGETVKTTTSKPQTEAEKVKSYRDILHGHETGAHAKPSKDSNWLDPEHGVRRIKLGNFAFHVDVATAYKIIADEFSEKEICELTELELFLPQKMMAIVQKRSPLKKTFSYGLRRLAESGIMDYERKIWHSPKPPCVKHMRVEDLQVDMETFTSALFVLIYGAAVSLLTLALEIMHYKLWRHRHSNSGEDNGTNTTTSKGCVNQDNSNGKINGQLS